MRYAALKFIVCLLYLATASWAADPKYLYYRSGKPDDVSTKTTPGYALMGGGTDLNEAFQWMCQRAHGGDFLVLRATGDNDYNPYVAKLCKLHSISTLVIPDKQSATDPRVAEIIRQAEAIFIAGGDQSSYIKFWQGTPVQDAINERIRKGVPVGGTSAGLAVLGQFVFAALNDSVNSKDTLANPYNEEVTIAQDFLKIPHLENIITDTHFAKRDRLGRFLGFLARIMADGKSKDIRGIAIDEKAAALLDADGHIKIVGKGMGAYFMRPAHMPEVCRQGQPLTFKGIEVYKAPPGATFDLNAWKGSGGTPYTLDVSDGKVASSQADSALY